MVTIFLTCNNPIHAKIFSLVVFFFLSQPVTAVQPASLILFIAANFKEFPGDLWMAGLWIWKVVDSFVFIFIKFTRDYFMFVHVYINTVHFQIACTLLKMLSLPRGAGRLGVGALAKVCQEEKQDTKSALLQYIHRTNDTVFFWQINHSITNEIQLTKRSFWSELSDLGSRSMGLSPQRAAFSADGGVLIL